MHSRRIRDKNISKGNMKISSKAKINTSHGKMSEVIPVGRQLERTPPTKQVHSMIAEQSGNQGSLLPLAPHSVKQESDTQPITQGGILPTPRASVKTEHHNEEKPIRRSSVTVAAKTGDSDPDTFIQGMQGYEWTEADLAFVSRTKQEKHVQQLQKELADLSKALKSMLQIREHSFAAREKIQSELSKIPSCELVLKLARGFLLRTQDLSEMEELDSDSVFAQIKAAHVRLAAQEVMSEVSKLERKVSSVLDLREQEKQNLRQMEAQKDKTDAIKANIDALKKELVMLESQSSGREVTQKSAQPWVRAPKAPKAPKVPNLAETQGVELRRSKRIAQKKVTSSEETLPKRSSSRR